MSGVPMRQGVLGSGEIAPFEVLSKDGLPDSHRLCRKTDEGATARVGRQFAYRYSLWTFCNLVHFTNGGSSPILQLLG